MKPLKPEQPIGIFDSGVGGLTIAKAVVDLLPNENIIYFGDTAFLPYGDKSKEIICERAQKITDFLLKQNCKLILIACNSASAAAHDELKKTISGRALLINVIDPVINFIDKKFAEKQIGLIGTQQTINSKTYEKEIKKLHKNIQLDALATPLLASAIENQENYKIKALLKQYLSAAILQNIDALILGCTHYPMIKDYIRTFYHDKIDMIDAPEITAKNVKNLLEQHDLLNPACGGTRFRLSRFQRDSGMTTGNKHFYVSNYTDSFAREAKFFFGEKITLEDQHL